MVSCSSNDDTDATPTKDKSDTTTTKDEDKTFTVIFDGNGNTGDAPTTQTVAKDSKATKPVDPTRDGYTFDGWYKKQDSSGTAFAFDANTITADITLYAKWTAIITYTVTFDLGGGTGDTPDQTVAKDNKATKPAALTRDGYTFDGWYTQQDDSGTAFAFGTTTITADITLYAKWIQIGCRKARKALTHVVPLYNQGAEDAPYLPEKLRGNFVDESNTKDMFIFGPKKGIVVPAGKDNQLPYIRPDSHYIKPQGSIRFKLGRFDITPDYIDSSRLAVPDPIDNLTSTSYHTIRISCYSVKKINENLYFYYGKVRFLLGGQETEAFNKTMYAWTGIDKRDASTKDALYGYMVSIQGDRARTLNFYPFVGGIYTRAATGTDETDSNYMPEKTVTFPKTEKEYAALTLEDLKIIATAPLTSNKLFEKTVVPATVTGGIYGID